MEGSLLALGLHDVFQDASATVNGVVNYHFTIVSITREIENYDERNGWMQFLKGLQRSKVRS